MEKSSEKLSLGNSLIVVEGKSDVTFLTSFIDTEFFITNGSDLNSEKINYLLNVEKKGIQIYVLTDPDFPGEKIRKIINEKVRSSINIFLPKEKCIKNKKLGVAESDKETVLESFRKANCKNGISHDSIMHFDVFKLGLSGSKNSSKIREELSKKYSIGLCNSKTMIKRLEVLGVSTQQLKEDIAQISSKIDK